jgi:hypothetical protein
MSQELHDKEISPYASPVLAELKEKFGPWPVLSTEDATVYVQILVGLIETFRPQDIMEKMLIREAADSIWDGLRCARHKTQAIERGFRDRQKFQLQGRKAAAQKKAAFAKRLSESKVEPATEPEEATDGLVEEIDGIVLEPATELDHACALEAAIVYVEKLSFAEFTRHRDGGQSRMEAFFWEVEQDRRTRIEQIEAARTSSGTSHNGGN